MFRFLIFFFMFFSTVSRASFSLPVINWKNLEESEREFLISSLKDAIKAFSDEDGIKTVRFTPVISEAYAANADCFALGWPSLKDRSGKCQDPSLHNPFYENHRGCKNGQRLCHPALFGEEICVSEAGTFAQCEEKFRKSGRLFSEVVESGNQKEFSDLIATVFRLCVENKSREATCQELKRKLDSFVPNEDPANLKAVTESMKDSGPERLMKATQNLQKEMEEDLSEFKKNCEKKVPLTEYTYCKNHAQRVKKAVTALGPALNRLKALSEDPNCDPAQFGQANDQKLLSKASCAANEKDKSCGEEVKCIIASTALSSLILFREGVLQKKTSACLNSENNCIANVISSLVKSLVSLVTGLWDLLGLAVNWAGDRLGEFWSYVKGVEDKTADAQHLLNKMSPEDLKQVKTNPVEWIKNLATNIWEGTQQWIYEDVFCEKWEGIPRASRCVTPSTSFGCMSCGTKIRGGCSALGVIVGEVVPAFLTGGAVNVVSRAGTGAKAFLNVIKASRNYQKVASRVEALSEIKGVELTLNTMKAPLTTMARGSQLAVEAMGQSFKKLTSSESFKKTMKAMDGAAKYTGLKLLNHVNKKAYEAGNNMVDGLLGKADGPTKAARAIETPATNKISLIQSDIEELDSYNVAAWKKGEEIETLNSELQELQKGLNKENYPQYTDLKTKIKSKGEELKVINNNFLNRLQLIYQREGIPSQLLIENGTNVIVLDMKTPPVNSKAFEFFRKIKKKFDVKELTISLKENVDESSLAFYKDSNQRLEIGPTQAISLLEDHFDLISKHEARHALFHARRRSGVDSIFHVRFRSSTGRPLNELGVYENAMSAEELYTHSTDLQSFAQMLKGDVLHDPQKLQGILERLNGRVDMLKRVSKATQDLGRDMLSTLNDITKKPSYMNELTIQQIRDGSVSFRFKDKLGREGEVFFVEPTDKVRAENIKSLRKRIEDFSGPSQNRQKLLNELDQEVAPFIEKAKEKYNDLFELSQIQAKETERLMAMLKVYSDKGIVKIEDIKAELFRIAKNVKEDYKGFALNPQ